MRMKNAAVTALALMLAIVTSGCAGSQQASTTSPGATTGQSGAAQLASPAQLGQQIFTTGNAADGSAIPVSSGAGGPCARCHGNDATGKIGPDVRWTVLTGSASASHAPRFPLTSDAQFVAAVTTGQVGSNALLPMMPHYQLTPAQSAALIAYLKTL